MTWHCPDCHRVWKNSPPSWHYAYILDDDGVRVVDWHSRYRCKGKPVSGGADDDSD